MSEVSLEISQEDAAVLNAIRQVIDSTGFGRVVVDIKNGQIVFIEVSMSVLIKRSDGKIIISSRGTRPEQS